jgi:hypothetical protein
VGRKGTLRLDALDQQAQTFLKNHYSNFPPAKPLSLIVWVLGDHANRLITLRYTGDPGETYWSVTLNDRGTPVVGETGISHDEAHGL